MPNRRYEDQNARVGRVPEHFLRFSDIVSAAAACTRCNAMAERTAVLGPANGPVPAALMFIAEAPGRFGADRTGVPLCGDRSGSNFDALINEAGLKREGLFITNAVLCNPRDECGRNRKPSKRELLNCSRFLAAQLDIVNPKIVATLGATALEALRMLEPHDLSLAVHAGRPHMWRRVILMPLYHPSPRARVHRSLVCQKGDFLSLADLVFSVS